MTLIITELSSLGIVMVGDTAQSVESLLPNRAIGERAFFGLIKVIPIMRLRAGASYWGWTKMPPDENTGVWLDWWLQDFIDRRHGEYETVEGLARLLEHELRGLVPRLTEDELSAMPFGQGGIHLAGFADDDGRRVPCFWHIHNGRSQAFLGRNLDPHIVNANYDCPPTRFLEFDRRGHTYVTRNGDIDAYGRFFERHLVGYVEELNRELGILAPLPLLSTRAEFWSAQIEFISALYEASGLTVNGGIIQMVKGIGDQVTTLTITPSDIRSYFTR